MGFRGAFAIWVAVLVVASGCGDGSSASGTESTHEGFIYIDTNGSQLCGLLAESYPPQCGDPIVGLGDLAPNAVVALQSPDDPTIAPVSWTDYVAGVSGDLSDDVLTNVTLTDPVATSQADGLQGRVADLGIESGEPVSWPIDLRNATDAPIHLTFTDGQRVEVTLEDGTGEVYRWSDGMLFAQIFEVMQIPPGAVFGAVVTAEPIDLPPGDYEAKAWVTAYEARNVVVTWTTTIE